MMTNRATNIWPAIRAHIRHYGEVSYSGKIPNYVGEWEAARLIAEKARKDGRITYVFGASQ